MASVAQDPFAPDSTWAGGSPTGSGDGADVAVDADEQAAEAIPSAPSTPMARRRVAPGSLTGGRAGGSGR